MLFTRCPSCDTTFRVTDEALTKAGGQVRCGRCASVFNAYTELRETSVPDEATTTAASPSHAATAAPARAPPTGAAKASPQGSASVTSPQRTTAAPSAPARPQSPAAKVGTAPPSAKPAARPPAAAAAAATPSAVALPAATPPAPAPPSAASAAPPPSSTGRAGTTRAAERLDDLSEAPGVEQPKQGTVESRLDRDDVEGVDVTEQREASTIGAHGVQVVLETEPTADSTTASWAAENRGANPHERLWRAGAALALLLLVAQAVHFSRAELASGESLGPWIQRAYRTFGAPITPRWDIEQYQILDWVAAAEPNTRGLGALEITARIHNRGPRRQPHPQIKLQLKDRYEETVGSRVFHPAEYLNAATADAMMSAGDTAQAHITVVDPGPDAYGFELDVCVEAEADELTCGNDEVFLR